MPRARVGMLQQQGITPNNSPGRLVQDSKPQAALLHPVLDSFNMLARKQPSVKPDLPPSAQVISASRESTALITLALAGWRKAHPQQTLLGWGHQRVCMVLRVAALLGCNLAALILQVLAACKLASVSLVTLKVALPLH